MVSGFLQRTQTTQARNRQTNARCNAQSVQAKCFGEVNRDSEKKGFCKLHQKIIANRFLELIRLLLLPLLSMLCLSLLLCCVRVSKTTIAFAGGGGGRMF